MRKRIALAAVGAAALLVPVSGAVAGNGDKATGGGQVLLGDSGKRSTIAFTAQGTTTAAKGQVQFIDRSAGTGQSQVKYHGVVDCLEVTENYAVIGGYEKGTDNLNRFVLRVVDNGQGSAAENDLIQFDDATEDNRCGDDEEDEAPEFALSRGNAQVRDGDSSNPPSESRSTMSFAKALKLAGLRR